MAVIKKRHKEPAYAQRNDNKVKIEVNLFDFEAMIYDETIRISFHDRVRSEKTFASLEDLKKQLANDKENCLLILD